MCMREWGKEVHKLCPRQTYIPAPAPAPYPHRTRTIPVPVPVPAPAPYIPAPAPAPYLSMTMSTPRMYRRQSMPPCGAVPSSITRRKEDTLVSSLSPQFWIPVYCPTSIIPRLNMYYACVCFSFFRQTATNHRSKAKMIVPMTMSKQLEQGELLRIACPSFAYLNSPVAGAKIKDNCILHSKSAEYQTEHTHIHVRTKCRLHVVIWIFGNNSWN